MKNKFLTQKVNLFQNLLSIASVSISLDEVLRLIQYDSSVDGKTMSYRKMRAALGKPKADEEVKQKLLPAISVAVLVDGNGRKSANVLGFTGLALVDLDHIDAEKIDDARQRIAADPHTLLVYRTVSGEGLRIIYHYEREGAEQHIDATTWPAAFLKGNRYFSELAGHDYDAQCADYTRLCGMAHDEQVYVNREAMPFTITDEEILAANFSAGKERGRPLKEQPAGTYEAKVEDAWAKVEQTLERRGMAYRQGHHHDYVMHAAFLMNRYGVGLEELLAWAAQEWSDYDGRQREATIRSCYGKTQEHGTWRLGRKDRKAKETSMIALPEIRDWLTRHVEVIYNVVTDRSMWRLLGSDEWQSLDERVLCSIRSQMADDTGKRVLKNDVRDILSSDFARLHNPVREYVEALPPWDGTDRVEELCRHVRAEPVRKGQSGEEAQGFLRWALHKWLVAMVVTWMKDLAANHGIFVLIGQQGIYKTTFFRHLLPPPLRGYFIENPRNSLSAKDDHLAITENCLIELEELDLQNLRDISELKALVTSECVKARRPYARLPEIKYRLASFCGSGNQEHFLTDETGNRRFLCVKVSHIDDPRTWGIDYDQLYAQLHNEWQQGFQFWFDADEQQRVERQNEFFRIESNEEQLIRTRLRPPEPGDRITLMNAASICQFINGGIVGRELSTRKIGIIMQRMGFKQVRKRQGNFYSVCQIPPDRIQSSIAMGDDDGSDGSEMQVTEGALPF